MDKEQPIMKKNNMYYNMFRYILRIHNKSLTYYCSEYIYVYMEKYMPACNKYVYNRYKHLYTSLPDVSKKQLCEQFVDIINVDMDVCNRKIDELKFTYTQLFKLLSVVLLYMFNIMCILIYGGIIVKIICFLTTTLLITYIVYITWRHINIYNDILYLLHDHTTNTHTYNTNNLFGIITE